MNASRRPEAESRDTVQDPDISGAEAKAQSAGPGRSEASVSQVQKLKLKLEAKTMEYVRPNSWPPYEALRRELREAKAQVSEYPHEREAVANEREVIISAQRFEYIGIADEAKRREATGILVREAGSVSGLGTDE